MLLAGRRALIMGLANHRSLAWGVARHFAAQGARLAFTHRSESTGRRIAPLAEELGAEAVLPCDLNDDEALGRLAERIGAVFGGLDVVVHSVAFARREDLAGRTLDTTREGFTLAMQSSAYSLIAACRALEPLLAPGASVLAMSYLGAERSVRGYNVMGLCKAALEAGVRALAAELGPRGVRVNALSAGPLRTRAATAIKGFHTVFEQVERRAPLRRNVTLDDVGRAAVYLASELSSGTTGETLHVDCGFASTAL